MENILGKNLRRYRLSRDLRQAELANEIGVSVNTIRQYEGGKRQPREKQLSNICEFFGCSISDLYSETVKLSEKEPEKKGAEKKRFVSGASFLNDILHQIVIYAEENEMDAEETVKSVSEGILPLFKISKKG